MKVINPLEKFKKKDDDVVCFLSGPCIKGNKWRDEIISFLENIEKEETLNLENLVLVNPERKDWNSAKSEVKDDDLNDQIQWEAEMLDQCDIGAFYFEKSKEGHQQPMTYFEMGKCLAMVKAKFATNKLNYRLLVFAHPEYKQLKNLKAEIAYSTKNWKTEIEVVDTNKSISKVASGILEAYMKISK